VSWRHSGKRKKSSIHMYRAGCCWQTFSYCMRAV